jgi:hypothetical protein
LVQKRRIKEVRQSVAEKFSNHFSFQKEFFNTLFKKDESKKSVNPSQKSFKNSFSFQKTTFVFIFRPKRRIKEVRQSVAEKFQKQFFLF